MTSPTGQQIIIILPNISRSKGNQEIKFRQLIEYNVRNNFLQRLWRKCVRETSSRLLPVFKGTLNEVKASGQHLSFHIFW